MRSLPMSRFGLRHALAGAGHRLLSAAAQRRSVQAQVCQSSFFRMLPSPSRLVNEAGKVR